MIELGSTFRSVALLVLAGGMAGGLASCNPTAGNTGCTADYDCAVGQLCGTDGTCAAAPAGAQRTFGKVDLDFSTGNEVYLVGVQAVPQTEATSSDSVLFTLSGAGANGQALRIAAPPVPLDPTWKARIAFETKRRQEINAYVADLRAGRRSIAAATSRVPLPCSGGCPSDLACFGNACVTSGDFTFHDGTTQVSTTLVGVAPAVGDGVPVDVLLDTNDDDGPSGTVRAAVMQAGDDFAATLGRELTLLGTTYSGPVDHNNDGRLTVIFTNETGSGTNAISTDVVGFFDFYDFLPDNDPRSTGNDADILWVRVPGTTNNAGKISEQLAVGTMAHEFTHLVSYALRVQARGSSALREVTWLDEGTAHLMEDLTGWGASDVGIFSQALSQWSDVGFATSDDTPAQRGHTYMLLRHIIDMRAKAAGATSASDSTTQAVAATFVSSLLQEDALGFEHSVFQQLGPDGLWRWIVASYATDNPDVTFAAAHDNDFLPVSPSADTGTDMGFDPFYDYTDARGTDVQLDGLLPDDISDLSSGIDGDVIESGNTLYLISGQSGTLSLVGKGDAQVDLHLEAQRVQ